MICVSLIIFNSTLWICEEKELVHEIAGLGELRSPWHECQMSWLQNHLNIINAYSQALENLDTARGEHAMSKICRVWQR